MLASRSNAHVRLLPALTSVNVPAGAVASAPRQTMVPSALSPQVSPFPGARLRERAGERRRLAVIVAAPAAAGVVGLERAGVREALAHPGKCARRRVVAWPASDAAVKFDAADAPPARADLGERVCRRGRPAAPAGHRAVGFEPTRVADTRAHLGERTRGGERRRRVVGVRRPTSDGAVGLDPAGVPGSGADLGEVARWECGDERARRRRPKERRVIAPADGGAVGLEPTGVVAPRAHLGKRANPGRRLAVAVVAPTDDRAEGFQEPAGVIVPRAHLGEGVRWWRRLAGIVGAPAGDGAIGLDPAGVGETGAHLGERAGWW